MPDITANKQTASNHLATALQSRGFLLEGYTPTQITPHWLGGDWMGGRASHPDWPGYYVECGTDRAGRGFWAWGYNGTDDRKTTYNQGRGYRKMVDSLTEAQAVATAIVEQFEEHDSDYPDNLAPDVWQCPEGIQVKRNQDLNGLEIRFPGKPDASTRAWLKAPGRRFRYTDSNDDKRWYKSFTPELLATVLAKFNYQEEKKAS